MIYALLLLALCALYISFLFWCLKGWKTIKNNTSVNILLPTVTVIVACRNEERTIIQLLKTLEFQNYSKEKLNLVIVDDHSDDTTVQVLNDYFAINPTSRIQLVSAAGTGKKEAINQAVNSSTSEIILTIDADCIVGKDWVLTMVKPFANPSVEMVAGPVLLTGKKSWLGVLQQLEMIGLTGISGGAMNNGRAMMCNGANLSYRRSSYLRVNGFSGNTFASGDDTQLMQKLAGNNPASLFYQNVPSAIVRSEIQNSIHLFWHQRRRWATKIPFTLSFFTVLMSILAWFVHVGLFIQMLSLLICPKNYLIFLASVFIKASGESLFLKKVGKGLGVKLNLLLIFIIQPLYWIYITIIGAAVPFSNYQWKGRKVK